MDRDQVIAYGQEYLIVNGATYWMFVTFFIFRYTLQGLGQSVVPTIACIMELLMRSGAAIFLCAACRLLWCLRSESGWPLGADHVVLAGCCVLVDETKF